MIAPITAELLVPLLPVTIGEVDWGVDGAVVAGLNGEVVTAFGDEVWGPRGTMVVIVVEMRGSVSVIS